ncbi:hypothetical protein [Megasphaera sp.]|uniref:hyaluronate lyase N-terminal domain-containing protein n=1 Tax=Megasphaera sp. TaxID=2023260 RepID=UPI00307F6058
MSEQTLKVKTLYLRNDAAATWVEKNPVLAKGEPGVEVDTGKFKLGDGVTQLGRPALCRRTGKRQ